MRKNILLGSVLAALALASSPVKAEEGVYLGLGGGINLPSDSNVRGVNTSTSVDLDSGWVAKALVGYDFGNNWRTELEAARRENSNGNSNNVSGIGDIKIWSAMANVVYDFDLNIEKPIKPFVGLGLGYAWFDPDNLSPLSGGQGILSENSGALAYQAFAGAAYNVYKNLDVSLEYRYFLTSKQSANTSNAFAVDSDYKSHDILLGLRWNLGKPTKTKETTKSYAIKPFNYLVFFDFDKADVTTTAKDIIKSASESFKQNQSSVVIELTGHTDKSGSEAYNMNLSKRRAKSVMAELVKLGIPEETMVVYGKGESKPLIPTPDGIREPQNRRVEIVIK